MRVGEIATSTRPRSSPPVALGDLAGVLEVAEDLAGGPDERLACGGQHQPAPDPAERFDAEVGLQPPDDLRQGRLRQVDRGRGPGDAALVDDGEEALDLADVHVPIQGSALRAGQGQTGVPAPGRGTTRSADGATPSRVNGRDGTV